ncbi:EAL domain-containing protein [Mycobacterium sp. SMC-4]|uniref:sensor domain-containing phosphodiesterase n=1 Tax=Mycobacterium sp. SMC-4 TaxID=2857059 RepID=UPI003CFCD5DA
MKNLVGELIASVDPLSLMHRIVEQVCARMPTATGASVCLLDARGNVEVLATHGSAAPVKGRITPAGQTFQSYPLKSCRPEIVNDALIDPRLPPEVRDLSTRLGARSCLSIPLIDNGRAIGTLSLIAEAPYAFSDRDVARVSSITEFLGVLISSTSELARLLRDLLEPTKSSTETDSAAYLLASVVLPELTQNDELRGEVDRLIVDDGVHAVFQPIVDLATRHVVGFEGLCRFPSDEAKGPDEWIRSAHRVGRGSQLELKALRTVLAAARSIPERYYVAVNLSPRVIADVMIQCELRSVQRDLVVELTEHDPAPDLLKASLEPLRANGIRLAVDDAGSGFAGLATILRLSPDMIKLDRELIAGLESDPAKRALATALAHFARETNAVAVAEGIENERQAQVLHELGIRYGQGFFLGMPQTVCELLPPMGGSPQ